MVAVAGRLCAAEPAEADGAGEPPAPTPPARALAALRSGDRRFPAGWCGPFVIVAAEPGRRRVSVTRDHLGSLKVYYFVDRRWLIAASEPSALLRHEAVGDDLDEVAAARFLGFRFGHTERSFFRRIKELPPAHRLVVTADGFRTPRYWRFGARAVPGVARERVPAELVRRVEHSLSADLADLEPRQVGLSLSGGLDSTMLAALAPGGTRMFSWRLPGAAARDERRNVEAVAEHLGLSLRWVDGDGLHPLCGGYVERFVHRNSPHLNPFAALKHRLYRSAAAEGCRRIVVGDGGDVLYAAERYWLRDLLAGRERGALRSLLRTVREASDGDRLARLALRRLAPVPPLRRRLGRAPQPWLTSWGRSQLPRERFSPILPEVRWPRRYDLSVGAKHVELESEEQRLFAQCGVGRSNPFWSWPLLEMVIHLPAWWLHRDGVRKILSREAMRGRLPERVLHSGTVGLLGSFFLRGIERRRSDIRRLVFRRPRSDWQRYVKRRWLEPYLEATGSIDFGHTILWRVISYELWIRRQIGSRISL